MVAEEGLSAHALKAQRGIQALGTRILPIDNKAHALMSFGKDLRAEGCNKHSAYATALKVG
jgi:hypothetical protein